MYAPSAVHLLNRRHAKNTLETGYKKAGYKNKSLIRLLFTRTKACTLSTTWIAYKNKSHIRPSFSGTKGLLISGFQWIMFGYCNFPDVPTYAFNADIILFLLKTCGTIQAIT